MNRRCALIALAVALSLAGANAAGRDEPTERVAQEAQAKQKLDQVRADIRRISDEQRATAAQRNDATLQLRARELKIAETAKELRAFDAKLAAQQARLDQSLHQRDALETSLSRQREALAALLRSVYALGQNEDLRLLLMQEQTDSVARLLAYSRYFERARVGQIAALLKDLDALVQVQAAIVAETTDIETARAGRVVQASALAAEREERRQLLLTLDATLNDQQSRLAALGRDEKGLLQLLEKLRDIFADIPKQIAGAEPFTRMRGRLPWPLRGALQSAGDEKENHGVLIAAAEGGEVHAVSHGRVVFADWLRGYGLLLIIDHGEGYLSLYGCNETLLKDVGDWVDAGEIVATSGSSGGRKMPGLYFELRHVGKPMDARAWLRATSH